MKKLMSALVAAITLIPSTVLANNAVKAVLVSGVTSDGNRLIYFANTVKFKEIGTTFDYVVVKNNNSYSVNRDAISFWCNKGQIKLHEFIRANPINHPDYNKSINKYMCKLL